MKMSRYFGAAAVAAVFGLCVQAHAATLINATTSNGSFETIDPHTAPVVNAGGRRASSDGSAFTVANLSIDPDGGFGGIDGSQIGDPNPSAPNRGQDGDKVLLANNGVSVEAIFAPIAQAVSVGDTFELSAYTGRNSGTDSFDYSFTLRFDGNPANDIVLLSGTDTNTDVWTLQSSGPILSPVAASSVELIVVNDNSNGGNDQTYIDNITLTHTAIPEPASLALFALGMCGLGVARRRK